MELKQVKKLGILSKKILFSYFYVFSIIVWPKSEKRTNQLGIFSYFCKKLLRKNNENSKEYRKYKKM